MARSFSCGYALAAGVCGAEQLAVGATSMVAAPLRRGTVRAQGCPRAVRPGRGCSARGSLFNVGAGVGSSGAVWMVFWPLNLFHPPFGRSAGLDGLDGGSNAVGAAAGLAEDPPLLQLREGAFAGGS